jgi:NADH:ubiquinone oxidoreductase subunit 2 (subunit N)
MYMREPQTEAPPLTHSRLLWGGLAAATFLTIILGLFPGPFLDIVNEAARSIAPG